MAIKVSKTFLMRKLHQITGIVPLGAFFFVHLYANSAAMNGAKSYNEHVKGIHDIPYLLFLEIFGIFLPLVFHSVYGIFITAEARSNIMRYGYGRNWFYWLQRATGVFLFFFLLFHILNFRFGAIPGLNTTPVAGHANIAFDIVAREFANIAILILYIVGIAATAWHLGYGLFLFALDWGLVIGEKSQRYALYGSLALAAFLFAVGTNAAVAFVRPCGLFPQAFCEKTVESGIVDSAGDTRKF